MKPTQIDRQRVGDRHQQLCIRAELFVAVTFGGTTRLIERAEPVALEPACADARRYWSEAARDVADDLPRIAPAIFATHIGAQRLGRRGGQQVDDAADRLAAPDHRLAAANHLDPADIAGQQRAEVEPAAGGGGVVQLHPVDQHDVLVVLRPPDAEARDRARPAAARHGDAGNGPQQVGHRLCLAGADFGGGDDRDRLAGVGGGLW